MLLRLLVICGLLWAMAQTVKAEEGILNNPPESVALAKTIIGKLDPSYETLWLVSDGTFSQGVSASLWNVASNEIHLASLRMGFGTNENLYGGIGVDVPGLCKRFIPQTIKGIATMKPLNILWSVAGKYARITPLGGYSWNEEKPIYGMAVGAALTF